MYKALLVDDEPLILEGLQFIVDWEEHGFELAGMARNAEEALELMERTAVDLLLTDIRMPKLSGLELIERIQASQRPVKFVILSGYNDFELVKKAATLGIENYLIKPVNRQELSSTLVAAAAKLDNGRRLAVQQTYVREAIDILRDNVLLRLATGQIGVHEFAEKSAFLRLELGHPAFGAAVVRTIRDRLPAGPVSDAQLVNFAVRNVCSDTLASYRSSGIGGYAFNDSDKDIVLLVASKRGAEDDVRRMLRCLIDNCFDYLKQEVFVALGAWVEQIHDVGRSYQHAKDLADYSLVLPERQLIVYGEETSHRGDLEQRFYEDFEQIQKNMLAGNREAVADGIRSIYRKIGERDGRSPALVYNATVEMLYYMVHGANLVKKNAPVQLLNEKEFLFEVLKGKTLEEICDSVLEAMERILAHSGVRDSLIEAVLVYLNENYAEEISLQQLSARFHINAAYLGQLFKRETGKLFSAYLNELRVGKAVELLQNTPITAKEAALRVGYANPDYFYKIFKKITGVYPSEYA